MNRTPATLLLLTALLPATAAAQAPHDPLAGSHHQHAPNPGPKAADESAADGESALRHEGPPDHSFADADAWAERFESAEREAWQMPDKVVEVMGLEPGASVADIGSGTGYFTRRFATAVGPEGTAYAADIEPTMAEYVRRRADEDGQRNLVPVLASYDDPRLPNNAVDLVFICNTWHHIQDRVEYARRLAGDLAVGGRVAIVDFLPGELPVGPRPEHKLSAEEVSAEFRQAGFRQVASHDFLPYQYVLVFSAPSRSGDRGVSRAVP
jgi:ubiquinone/menaquinone biosynthesis C-methylase UbiE